MKMTGNKQKQKKKISLSHVPKKFKVLFAYAGYRRISDNKRMTAEIIMESYITEEHKHIFITPL